MTNTIPAAPRVDQLIEQMELCARAYREPNSQNARAHARDDWYRALGELARVCGHACERHAPSPEGRGPKHRGAEDCRATRQAENNGIDAAQASISDNSSRKRAG